jgi:predicted patatin/cPLA2 family phospholipase
MVRDLAIVTSGGGMNCAYSAGFVYGLAQDHPEVIPKLTVALSGSVGTMAYYVAGQTESIKRIWTELLSTENFINLARFWKVIDIGYLVDVVFDEQEPLDWAGVASSQTELVAGLFSKQVGSHFASARGLTPSNVKELIRAANSLPYLYGRLVAFDGENYGDGGTKISVAEQIDKAREMGAKKILVVRSESQPSLLNNSLVKSLFGWHVPPAVLNVSGDMFVVDQPRDSRLKLLNNDRDHLKVVFESGRDFVRTNKSLATFLEER